MYLHITNSISNVKINVVFFYTLDAFLLANIDAFLLVDKYSGNDICWINCVNYCEVQVSHHKNLHNTSTTLHIFIVQGIILQKGLFFKVGTLGLLPKARASPVSHS